MRKLLTLLGIIPLCFNGFAQTLLIDDFSTTQAAIQVTNVIATAMSTQDGPGILGGERDLHLLRTTAPGVLANNQGLITLGSLILDNSSFSSSILTVIYDGDDNDATTTPNAIGLGGLDLKSKNAFFLDVINSDIGGTIKIQIFSGGGNSSTITQNIPPTLSLITLNLPFSDLTTTTGAGADLSNITAIALILEGNQSFDIGIDNFRVDILSSPIPTIDSWGLLIFGILIMNLSVFYVRKFELI